MKRLVTVLAAALMLAGCGGMHKVAAHYAGSSAECINHISYLQFPSGATVQIDPATDKPLHC